MPADARRPQHLTPAEGLALRDVGAPRAPGFPAVWSGRGVGFRISSSERRPGRARVMTQVRSGRSVVRRTEGISGGPRLGSRCAPRWDRRRRSARRYRWRSRRGDGAAGESGSSARARATTGLGEGLLDSPTGGIAGNQIFRGRDHPRPAAEHPRRVLGADRTGDLVGEHGVSVSSRSSTAWSRCSAGTTTSWRRQCWWSRSTTPRWGWGADRAWCHRHRGRVRARRRGRRSR